jgi:hypothetical protein
MAKLPPEQLKENFKVSVGSVWETWKNYTDSKKNPFKDPNPILETNIDSDLLRHWYSELSYAQGIHDATGWSLHDPSGPKEWSPQA